MKGYLCILKSSLMVKLSRKTSILFSFAANIFFVLIIFYLWSAIYDGSDNSINGLTLEETIIRLTMATCISSALITNIEWFISSDILTGDIITSLIKPVKLYNLKLFEAMGIAICNFITITLPTIVILFMFYNSYLRIGVNIIFFLISIIISTILVFNIDYIVGLTSFYTESIWGISITKNVIISILAGAVVPISFFPSVLVTVVENSPFYAIYQVPINMLIGNSNIQEILFSIFIQVSWCLIMFIASKLFTNKAMSNIKINGG